ncbi:transposase [Streptomyces sp. NPDC005728]|uniref:transposase n=1 Tax=Streptomyces sp. NPDC005728 TaxID=3157054 RepID=UPI0033D229F5
MTGRVSSVPRTAITVAPRCRARVRPVNRRTLPPAAGTYSPIRLPFEFRTSQMRTEASFAALCGAAPVPASSGRTNRHRLSRGGDRVANAALYRIAWSAWAATPAPASTSRGRPPPAGRRRKSSGS